MRLAIIAVLLILVPGRAAADEWKAVDTSLEVSYVALSGADYLQTRQIARDGREMNPIMGKHGDRVDVGVYFAVTTLAHVALARVLPRPYRTIAQVIGIGVQAGTVVRNYNAGYMFRF